MTHPETCPVTDLRWDLYQAWVDSEGGDAGRRRALSNALRLLVMVATGKEEQPTLAELKRAAAELTACGESLGNRFARSLEAQESLWHDHVVSRLCVDDSCGREHLAPCQNTCPAGIDIPGFMALIGHEQKTESTAAILQDNPLPFVCGLICPAPCESACLRAAAGGAVNIRAMKAVAARHALESGAYPLPEKGNPSGRKVAILGSGPAGLSAAYYLAILGHAVTIFEEAEEPGGMLRYGIPAYRLPRDILRQEIDQIRSLGVEIRTGHRVEDIEALKQEHDALFVAAGLQLSRAIPLEGIEQSFVLHGIEFLKDVWAGKNPRVGPHAVVIGGGNVAMDVALTARRQGAERVELFCLESRDEMPASPHELHEALIEGIIINNSWGPLKISADNRITFKHCPKVFDAQGRFAPQFDDERTQRVKTDHILLAVGQTTDLSMLEENPAVALERGLMMVDPVTLQTGDPKVFAGGDVVRGPRIAVEAVADGKRAALSIDAHLRGEPFDPAMVQRRRRTNVRPLPTQAADRTQSSRSVIPMLSVEERGISYKAIEKGLTDEMAREEAERCLRCDICAGCGLCEIACANMGVNAIRMDRTQAGRLVFRDFQRPGEHCIGCGACAQACPAGAIRLEDKDGIRSIIITGTKISENRLIKCPDCGDEYATAATKAHVEARLPESLRAAMQDDRCPACARRATAEARVAAG